MNGFGFVVAAALRRCGGGRQHAKRRTRGSDGHAFDLVVNATGKALVVAPVH